MSQDHNTLLHLPVNTVGRTFARERHAFADDLLIVFVLLATCDFPGWQSSASLYHSTYTFQQNSSPQQTPSRQSQGCHWQATYRSSYVSVAVACLQYDLTAITRRQSALGWTLKTLFAVLLSLLCSNLRPIAVIAAFEMVHLARMDQDTGKSFD